MSQWQPIDTAPKDGTSIITIDGDEIHSISRFINGQWLDDNGYELDQPPTHWLPLPEPPK